MAMGLPTHPSLKDRYRRQASSHIKSPVDVEVIRGFEPDEHQLNAQTV